MRLLVFGHGFTGHALARLKPDGWRIAGASRDAAHRAAMRTEGVEPVDPTDPSDLARAFGGSDAVLVAAPPDTDGCPGLRALAPLVQARPTRWTGYLSTTGVYGDRGGGWVFEDSELAPLSPEAGRRVAAEQGWQALAEATDVPLAIFRLPGIYGPGRSALDRVRAGDARRRVKQGQVFSRIHVDDLAGALIAAIARERAGVYNLCDDEPAPAADVTAHAARLLGLTPPPEEPFDAEALSPAARRFWSESKRVSNARAKAALGWRPRYPTYREGLAAVLAAGG